MLCFYKIKLKNMLKKLYNWFFKDDRWLSDEQIDEFFTKYPSRNQNIKVQNAVGSDSLKLFMLSYDLKSDKRTLVPLCVKFSIFGFSLNHWTLLEIKKNKNDTHSVILHDSKGLLRQIGYMLGLPSLKTIKQAVKDNFTDASFEVRCYSHQKDGYNCGRFVIGYIEQIILNDNHLSDPSNKFTDIDNQINEKIPNIQPNFNDNGNTEVNQQRSTQHRDTLRNQSLDQTNNRGL